MTRKQLIREIEKLEKTAIWLSTQQGKFEVRVRLLKAEAEGCAEKETNDRIAQAVADTMGDIHGPAFTAGTESWRAWSRLDDLTRWFK